MKQAVLIKTVPVNIFFHLHGRHLQYVLLGGITELSNSLQ